MLEHVWVAELACALVARPLGLDWRAALDLVSIGLCLFVATGRVGCLMIGCCHGHPSSIGKRYERAHVDAAFRRRWPVCAWCRCRSSSQRRSW
jgi:hypothetical protein